MNDDKDQNAQRLLDLYRKQSTESSSDVLDQRILNMAQQRAKKHSFSPFSNNRVSQFALAASLALTVGLVVFMQKQPEVDLSRPVSPELSIEEDKQPASKTLEPEMIARTPETRIPAPERAKAAPAREEQSSIVSDEAPSMEIFMEEAPELAHAPVIAMEPAAAMSSPAPREFSATKKAPRRARETDQLAATAKNNFVLRLKKAANTGPDAIAALASPEHIDTVTRSLAQHDSQWPIIRQIILKGDYQFSEQNLHYALTISIHDMDTKRIKLLLTKQEFRILKLLIE